MVCPPWECEQWTINPPPGFLACTVYACLRESVDSDLLTLIKFSLFLHDMKRHTWIVLCDDLLFYPEEDTFLSKRQYKRNTYLLVTLSQAVLVSAAAQLANPKFRAS